MTQTAEEILRAARKLIEADETGMLSVREACEKASADRRLTSHAFGLFLDQPGTGRGAVTCAELLDRFDRAIARAASENGNG